MPFNPRNPQEYSITGQAKDHRAKGNTMRIFSSIRYSLFALVLLGLSAAAFGQIGISVSIAPPELLTYEQPLCPGDGYLWTPGYWAYADAETGYYWVPGAWVMAPEPGFLWTPGYWGWGGHGYAFNEGYWGPHVGFYGGISYGFGYFGEGYQGGRWQDGHFFYNRSVNNVNVTNIHNVYNETVVERTTVRVSYNGGNGGIDRRPTPQEESFSHERHVPPVAVQHEHVESARTNPEQRASVIHGGPGAAASRPEAGRPENARPEAARPESGRPENEHQEAAATHPVVHPKDLPARQPFAAPNTGNAARDQKLQQQHTQLIAKQDQERQQLQQRQDQQHQQQTSQKANEASQQRLEQQHQQQTQKLQQKHTQQEQKIVQRASPKHD